MFHWLKIDLNLPSLGHFDSYLKIIRVRFATKMSGQNLFSFLANACMVVTVNFKHCIYVCMYIFPDDRQVNHSDHSDDDDEGVKGSSFSFVRSDSMPSKDEESSGDENRTQFAFIKEDDDVNDDVPVQSQDHESVKPEAENVPPIISTYRCL